MPRAPSRVTRLWVSIALVPVLGCASERVRTARHPRTEYVVVEPTVAPPVAAPEVETVVVAPSAAPAQVVAIAPTSAPEGASIENWSARYPQAAKELGAWAHDNPEAAKFVFEYDGHRPGRNRELILWAIYHPGEDVMVFAAKHPGWEWFDTVMTKHRAGAAQFLEWTRHEPVAAEELVGHPSGLLWVGEHLYAAEWKSTH